MDNVRIDDPITFEVVKNALSSLTDEMAITVMRTAHSEIVRDAMDFSTALCDAEGHLVAQGLTLPLHLGAIPDAAGKLVEKFDGDIHPGDVFVVNDPEEGGMHLPDIFLFKPIFLGGRLIAYAACVAHHTDIGGRVPGGNAVDSREIFEEGLQIPILKLYDRGEPNRSLIEIIAKNVRVPQIVLGDLGAQRAACHTCEQGYLKLIDRYGVERLEQLIEMILDYSERLLRARLTEVPEGTYAFEDHIDDDGFGSGPISIRVALTFSNGGVIADFSGTSRQVGSALNSTVSVTKSIVYMALMCVTGGEIPSNDGFYRPVSVLVPRGTILNPFPPAARAARGLTAFRVADCLFGALHQALPGRSLAAGDGGATLLAIGGVRSDGRPHILVEGICGGWGGRPGKDGVDGTSPVASNITNVPVEYIELHQPLKVEEFGFVTDTGGPGRWRGSLSVVRQLRFLGDRGVLQVRSDRRRFLPYGLEGGKPGSPSSNILNPGPLEEVLPTTFTRSISYGDVIRHITAGGGGYGDPRQRAYELVAQDVIDEKLSPDYALREYGVQVDVEELGAGTLGLPSHGGAPRDEFGPYDRSPSPPNPPAPRDGVA